ncbi:MAG: 3-phenylpropionate MFS transporter [Alphaproteobacteria bacterium]|nr:3-phenylpropionate MFS transporter [Alphaproteobacteria bacterium]
MRLNFGSPFRLGFYYFAIFTVAGVHIPFWPVWLTAQGLSAGDIGLLTGSAMFVRVFTGPLIAFASDRVGRRRTQIMLFSVLLGLSFFLFSFAHSFAAIFLVTLLTSTLIPTIMPLIDTLTLVQSTQGSADYGRVRLWGSISFIAASMAGGFVLARTGTGMILPMVLAGCVFTVAAAWLLPREDTPTADVPRQRPGWREALLLCHDRRFLLFVAAGSLIQAAHAVYYTFGTLNWQRLGISSTVIGALWALGVVAEIVLFAFSGRVIARFGPATLLALGGFAGVVRWTLTAFNPGVALLIPLQCMHAFTYGATHLAAMHFITRAAPAHLAVTAQGVYAAISTGIVIGGVTYASGFAYSAFGSLAFLGMAALCALGCIFALSLRRHWTGGVLTPSSPQTPGA